MPSTEDPPTANPLPSVVSVFGRSWEASVFPRVIVFDVDETLWPYWVDTDTAPPYRRTKRSEFLEDEKRGEKPNNKPNNKPHDGNQKDSEENDDDDTIVVDGNGRHIKVFPETETVLTTLRTVPGLQLAYASRTGRPEWLQALAEVVRFRQPKQTDNGGTDDESNENAMISMWDLPDYREIYPGSKLRHFRAIAAQSGVSDYHQMLFFDDEPYSNREVGSELGVTFVDAAGGISVAMVVRGLDQHAENCRHRRHTR